MMATHSPTKTSASASNLNSVLNTPKLLIPENHAHATALAELDQQLQTTSPQVVAGQPSPASSSPLTPDVILIDTSPPRAPVVHRHRLRRQHAVIEGVTTPRRVSSLSSPTLREQPGQIEAEISPNVPQDLQNLRRKLTYDEEEDNLLCVDVGVPETEEEKMETDGSHLQVSPVLMAVKSISGIISELVHQSCVGCMEGYPSQKDHADCMWLPWGDLIEKYFDAALGKLTEERFFSFVNHVYNVEDMFDDEQDECVREATEFFKIELKKKDVSLTSRENSRNSKDAISLVYE
ncbi:uncharacterized protein [Diadema antillarum]|uniref:uncharacterized protein n=1 Tax=Diadema antillarum TaxID=105358 RepID=UPI003A87B7B4